MVVLQTEPNKTALEPTPAPPQVQAPTLVPALPGKPEGKTEQSAGFNGLLDPETVEGYVTELNQGRIPDGLAALFTQETENPLLSPNQLSVALTTLPEVFDSIVRGAESEDPQEAGSTKAGLMLAAGLVSMVVNQVEAAAENARQEREMIEQSVQQKLAEIPPAVLARVAAANPSSPEQARMMVEAELRRIKEEAQQGIEGPE
jgi:hypothetical protein